MVFKALKMSDKSIVFYFWAGILFIPLVFLLAVGGIVWFGTTSAIQDTCELTCDPYVVEMCNSKMAVCRTPDGLKIREKKGKF